MVCWHPKGEVLVSCSYDDSIKVWVEDDGEWECAQTLAGPGLGHSSTVWGVAFDPSGQRMVSCSDDLTLKIWNCHFDTPGTPSQLITCLGRFSSVVCSVLLCPLLHVGRQQLHAV